MESQNVVAKSSATRSSPLVQVSKKQKLGSPSPNTKIAGPPSTNIISKIHTEYLKIEICLHNLQDVCQATIFSIVFTSASNVIISLFGFNVAATAPLFKKKRCTFAYLDSGIFNNSVISSIVLCCP